MSISQNRSFSLLTCSEEELEEYYLGMLQQEKVELAALKWTRSDIRRVRKLRVDRFGKE